MPAHSQTSSGTDVEIDPLLLSDLTDLPVSSTPTSDDLLPILRARFLEGLPYTAVSPQVLISVNPHHFVQANSDTVLADWNKEYYDYGEDGIRGRLGPHVWAISGRAYYYMRRTGQDQSIILTGETGSGKTETSRLLLRSLVDLATPTGKKGQKLAASIPAAFFVLDSFGHATTIANTNASRFGRYTELQFSESGRVVGLKGLEYYLEKSRVTSSSAGERNFHIFYYLMAGATADERTHLRLDEHPNFRYLYGYTKSNVSSQTDAARFGQVKEAFKTIGFPKKVVASICQILAAILHMGNIDFHMDRSRNMDSAVVKNLHVLEIVADFLGVDPLGLEFALTNKCMLVGGEICGVFLDAEGSSQNRDDLAKTLYGLLFSWIGEYLNQKLCKDDFSTFIGMADFPGPVSNTMGGGGGGTGGSGGSRDGCGIDGFALNLASERLQAFNLEQMFEANKAEYAAEGLKDLLPGLDTAYRSNSDCTRMLTNVPGGLVHIIDDQSRRRNKTEQTMWKAMTKRWGNHASYDSREGDDSLGRSATFTVSHWDGQVTYSVENFLSQNSAAVSPHFITLLGGSTPKMGADGRTTPGARDALSTGGSSLSFVRQLFAGGAVQTTLHPKNEDTIVGANQKVGPQRAPSTRRPKGGHAAVSAVAAALDANEEADANGEGGTAANKPRSDGRSVVQELDASLTTLLSTLEATKTWHIFCLRPNDSQLPNQVDARILKHQIRSLNLAELSQRMREERSVNLEIKEWWTRYSDITPLAPERAILAPLVFKDKAAKVKQIFSWSDGELAVGKTKVYLNDAAFRYLEDFLRANDPIEVQMKRDQAQRLTAAVVYDAYSPYGITDEPSALGGYNGDYSKTTSTSALPLVNREDDGFSPNGRYDGIEESEMFDQKGGFYSDEERSIAPTTSGMSRAMFDPRNMPEKDLRGDQNAAETVVEVKNTPGRKRWIALTWLFTWWIPSFCLRKCGGMKRGDVRMAWREKLLINMLIWLLCGTSIFVIAVLGNLICPTEHVFSPAELSSASLGENPNQMLVVIRGEAFDLTKFAPAHLPGSAVIPTRAINRYGGLDATDIFPVQVSALCNGVTGTVSPWVTLDSVNATDDISKYHDFRAWNTEDSRPDWYYETMIYLRSNFRRGFFGYTPKKIKEAASTGQQIAVYNGGVYDLSTYIKNNGGGIRVPDGQTAPADIDRAFMSDAIVQLFQTRAGQDITNAVNNLAIDPVLLERQKICLRNLFFTGKVDNRDSVQCQFSQYLLLALSLVMVSIIGFKFLAALQFGRRRKPEDYDKFVICQVPCYTEGEESLRNCIDSLTKLKYDDKRKLLLIICDGMIVGSGNDRPTPSIVLDILGADMTLDPEPLSFQSIGEGAKQLNMAKVYSGLHEAAGHIVPYIVVVKVGKPSERSRPGNRGKRDSQMLLMRFLNRVHFDSPMAPVELEMYHQIKNVIGVNPSFYEYMLMVDADTVVDPFSLNYLVGSFVEDRKVVGLCGETSLSNAKASWTTMMQVYEYFISHHLSKAFESLFGSVTCLPGCFSMYRIRSLEHKPLIISNNVIREYGENKVETLHVKNLLSLGEDRYLTTVMLKEFPYLKMKFCRDAKAKTIAPDDWKVLMSQRRRWINSTVHNLAELMFIDKLCGFCCFSMRFVVMIDLLSTLIAPVTVAYIVYLVYRVVAEHKAVPTLALIMLGIIYGLQALVFILHRKFEHVGWMLVYILAIPLFSFVLPLVSFWQMDDFSWGSTREIVGEKGKRLVVHDEGEFDPASIPLKSWQDFENELWEQGSNHSIGSLVAKSKRGDEDSRYGRDTVYAPSYAGGQGMTGSPRHSMNLDQQSGLGRRSFGGSFDGLGQQFGGGGSQYGGDMRAASRGSMAHYRGSSNNVAMQDGGRRSSTALTRRHTRGVPSDDVIIADVHQILASANLDTLTKKGVRQELEAMYGADLGDRKQLVNQTISNALGLA